MRKKSREGREGELGGREKQRETRGEQEEKKRERKPGGKKRRDGREDVETIGENLEEEECK